MRRLATVLGLVAAWCALWGSASPANLLSGAVVAILASFVGTGSPARGPVRLRPSSRFIGIVALDLVRSTFDVGREILTPTDRTEESIIAVELKHGSRRHAVLLVIAITVTPGTSVVDVDPETGTLYLHLLHDDRRSATIEHVTELGRLLAAALPSDDDGPSVPSEGVST